MAYFRGLLLIGGVLAGLVLAGAWAPVRAASDAVDVNDVVVLPLNKGKIVRLPAPARDVLVSNPQVADVIMKTPQVAYLLGQEVGDTNVFFFGPDSEEILRIEIRVELDLSGLRKALADLMPESPVTVTAVNQNIVLSGAVRSPRAAENARLIARRFVEEDDRIINMLQVASEQQVLLRVRVAEMQRSVVKELGFNTTIAGGGNKFNFNLSTGRGASPNAFGISTFNIISAAFDTLTSAIDALESQGLVHTLAEPNLTAISGENANFLVGGEFPIPVPQDADTITIEFRQFGVLLTFTPVVLDSGAISLRISTEVSQLSNQGAIVLANFSVPALTVNRAETTVELPSGGSLVIGGLLQNDIRNTIDGFPGLKDIPVLGALFRSVAFQKNETELVVAVTPYLVRAVDQKQIALPTDGFAPASDFDMYLLGRLYDAYAKPKGTQPPPGRLQGPIGYIME